MLALWRYFRRKLVDHSQKYLDKREEAMCTDLIKKDYLVSCPVALAPNVVQPRSRLRWDVSMLEQIVDIGGEGATGLRTSKDRHVKQQCATTEGRSGRAACRQRTPGLVIKLIHSLGEMPEVGAQCRRGDLSVLFVEERWARAMWADAESREVPYAATCNGDKASAGGNYVPAVAASI